MNNVRNRLADCFATVFPNLDAAEISKASISGVAEWDSLATVTLVALLEEEFAVSIGFEDMMEFVSFEVVADFIEQRSANQ